jgi:hypothetical protein
MRDMSELKHEHGTEHETRLDELLPMPVAGILSTSCTGYAHTNPLGKDNVLVVDLCECSNLAMRGSDVMMPLLVVHIYLYKCPVLRVMVQGNLRVPGPRASERALIQSSTLLH